MATVLNTSYHHHHHHLHPIIHHTCNNNGLSHFNFNPKSSFMFFRKPSSFKLRNCSATTPIVQAASAARLYISYSCPYAQRVWITRNCKGLQDTIRLVPIDLKNRPTWYKEKVYPENKVPALEHNNEVKGESLDLIQYIDSNFDGPPLFPNDPDKIAFAEELFSFSGSFYKRVITSLKDNKIDGAGAAFDEIEAALSKFDDGPFFLGKFSLVDIGYVPFIERFQAFFSEVKNYDITGGRPKFAVWVEEMNKNEAYKQTKRDPKEHVESYTRRFLSPR